MKILIVDDEPTILETVENKLRKEGFSTFVAESAEEGMRTFRKVKPDLVLLDIMLPQRSGYDFCKAVRRDATTPIIFLSAKAADTDRVLGLEMGADDYITKPFNLNEVAARVKAVLRRATGEPIPESIERGDLKIDPQRHEVRLGDRFLELSPKEFALLYFLAQHAGQVFSRGTLIDRVWGRDSYVTERSVDVHVRWLRTQIEDDPAAPARLITVRGVGYKYAG